MKFYDIVKNIDPILLRVSGLNMKEIPRFRGTWINEDNKICIYTRSGGGNDECYCNDDQFYNTKLNEAIVDNIAIEYEGNYHLYNCYWMINRKLKKKPNFEDFYYDEDDYTYAEFVFSPLPENEEILNIIKIIQSYDFEIAIKKIDDAVNQIDKLKKMTSKAVREKYPEILIIYDQLMELLKEKL